MEPTTGAITWNIQNHSQIPIGNIGIQKAKINSNHELLKLYGGKSGSKSPKKRKFTDNDIIFSTGKAETSFNKTFSIKK